MNDEELSPTRLRRFAVPTATGAHVDADGSPASGSLHTMRSFSMSAELELMCAWLDAG